MAAKVIIMARTTTKINMKVNDNTSNTYRMKHTFPLKTKTQVYLTYYNFMSWAFS